MTYRTLLALLASLSLLCWGCNGDDDDSTGDDDVTGDDDDIGDDDDDDDNDDDDTTGPPVEPYLTGTVYDVTCTTGLEGVRVTWCQESCIFKNTDADGVFVFDGLPEGEGVFDVVGHINPEERNYTGLIESFEIPATGVVTAPDVCLPEIPSVEALSGGQQTVAAGDGVELTFDPDDVEWVLGVPQIGAVEVPDTAWQYVEIPDVEVTAVWAFYVWGSGTETPIEAQVPMRGDVQCPDLIDNDCDGAVDEGCGPDLDGDGYSESDGDCDDSDATVHPGALPICDGLDNNCDGATNESTDDLDLDGFSECDGDCDDEDPTVNPDGVEICGDGVDNNCDGHRDEDCGGDVDSDGYTVADGDCDDTDNSIFPFAPDTCGDEMKVYWMSVEAEGWDELGPAQMDCGLQRLQTPAAGGLPELTWVATGRPL
jgi:hypothetical protein